MVRWEEEKAAGSENAMKYAQASSHISGNMIDDAKNLLGLMGVPVITAPSEGESQAAFMAMNKDAYAAASQDYDVLLFGAPVAIRNLAVTGKRKLPGKGVYVDVRPEIISLEETISRDNEDILAASLKGDGATIKRLSRSIHSSQTRIEPLFSELERLHKELEDKTIEFEEKLSGMET